MSVRDPTGEILVFRYLRITPLNGASKLCTEQVEVLSGDPEYPSKESGPQEREPVMNFLVDGNKRTEDSGEG